MQSIKNIYEKIYDFENLHKAWEEISVVRKDIYL